MLLCKKMQFPKNIQTLKKCFPIESKHPQDVGKFANEPENQEKTKKGWANSKWLPLG